MDDFLIVFIGILSYVALLFIIRGVGIGRKRNCMNCNNCCPDCTVALNRMKRLYKDKIIYHITFRIFEFKRYSCNKCGWEGLRWEQRYNPSRNH